VRLDRRLALVAAFIVLAVAYGFAVPAWEAPDEVAHMRYVEHLIARRSLPVQRVDVFGEEHQAPLYYALAALPVAMVDPADARGAFRWNRKFGWGPGSDVNMAIHEPGERFVFRGRALALRMVRTLSTAMGAGTVILTLLLAATVAPAPTAVTFLAGSVVAFNPQFLFLSSAANNDNLLILAFNACLLQLVRILVAPARPGTASWVWVGVWWSAALLTKMSAVTLALAIGATVVLRSRRGDALRESVRAAMVTAGVTALLTGWWFVRNGLLYGDPLGLAPYREAFGPGLAIGLRDLPDAFFTQFRSFWGMFGWMNLPAPSWFYVMVAAFTAASVAGLAMRALRRSRGPLGPAEGAVLLLALVVAVQEAFQLRGILIFGDYWTQGRYLFPVLPAGAVLSAIGLSTVVGPRGVPVVALATTVLLASNALYLLAEVILPAYS
jgi:hypothetical protein